MAKSYQLNFAGRIILVMWWSSTVAIAAEHPLVTGIESIPLTAMMYVIALSVVGGAAGTLTKLSRPDVIVHNLPLEITKDIVASLVAGILAFFFSSWFDTINFWLQAALVTMAGYGGSKVLDFALADGFFPWLSRVFGKVNPPQG